VPVDLSSASAEKMASGRAKSGRGLSWQGASPFAWVGAFRRAAAFHRAGNLAEAERVCIEILSGKPDHFEALHLLGMVAAPRFTHSAQSAAFAHVIY
jgi:hypothetical protein